MRAMRSSPSVQGWRGRSQTFSRRIKSGPNLSLPTPRCSVWLPPHAGRTLVMAARGWLHAGGFALNCTLAAQAKITEQAVFIAGGPSDEVHSTVQVPLLPAFAPSHPSDSRHRRFSVLALRALRTLRTFSVVACCCTCLHVMCARHVLFYTHVCAFPYSGYLLCTQGCVPLRQLFVRYKSTFTVNGPFLTTAEVKTAIQAKFGVPLQAQVLTFAGKALDDANSIALYSVCNGSTLHLALRGRGGVDNSSSGVYP